MDKWNKKNIILKHCPYGLQHFCDGAPNLSEIKDKASAKAKPPCPLRGDCPVRELAKGEEEST